MSGSGGVIPTLPAAPNDYDQASEARFRQIAEQAFETITAEIRGRALDSEITDQRGAFPLMPDSGRWFLVGIESAAPTIGTGSGFSPVDQVNYSPFIPHRDVSVSELAFEVTTAAAVGATARIGLYDSISQLAPGALLASSGDIATDSTGVKTFAPASAVSLVGGQVYWIAWAAKDDVPTCRAMQGNESYGSLGAGTAANALTGTLQVKALETLGGGWSTLPDPAGSVSWSTSGHLCMAVKV